jgi:hypothetical protein
MPARTPLHRLLSAVIFAVLWTAFMLWWTYPTQGIAHTAILAGIGVLLGGLWYWFLGKRRPSA